MGLHNIDEVEQYLRRIDIICCGESQNNNGNGSNRLVHTFNINENNPRNFDGKVNQNNRRFKRNNNRLPVRSEDDGVRDNEPTNQDRVVATTNF